MIRQWPRIRFWQSSATPRAMRVLLGQADAARDARDWQAAIERYGRYLAIHPDDAEILVQYGHALKEAGDGAAAVQAYRRALDLSPDSSEVRLHLAHCLKNTGHLVEAATEFRILRDSGLWTEEVTRVLCDEVPGLLMEAGDAHRDHMRWMEAEAAYTAYLEIDPTRSSVWVQLAHMRKEQGRLEDAAAAYEESVRLAPNDPEPWTHLAHLFRVNGLRSRSVRAFARAWALGQRDSELVEAFRNTAGYCVTEIATALEAELLATGNEGTPLPAFACSGVAISKAEAEGGQSVQPTGRGFDVVYLSGIDWGYRRQRPQHIAEMLGRAGKRVVYVSTVFDQDPSGASYSIIGQPAANVLEVRLRTSPTGVAALHFLGGNDGRSAVAESLLAACGALCSSPLVVVVDHPAWHPICRELPCDTLVYDCIDNIRAFPGSRPDLVEEEQRLAERADVLIATSPLLADAIAPDRRVTIIPNGCEHSRFATVAESMPSPDRVEIVYCGAIAEWFEWRWVEAAAHRHPNWVFRLIGEVTTTAVDPLRQCANVEFVGEVPYAELTRHLASASAAIIPFRLDALTAAVNPVKLYEYLAAGRPVVGSAMPELEANPWAHTAADAEEFVKALSEQVTGDDVHAHRERARWAVGHDWGARAAALIGEIEADFMIHQIPLAAAASLAPVVSDGCDGLPFADFMAFVAPFPAPGIVVEGWMGRIRAVDEIFADRARIYLHFTASAPAAEEPRWVHHSDRAVEVFVNPASPRHHAIVERIVRQCRLCYVQTVHLAKYVIGFYPAGKMITDFHGIVPEEEVMLGNPEAAIFYEAIESTVLQCSQYVVVVTEAMARHLREKYPFAQCEMIVLPIIVDYSPSLSPDADTAGAHVNVVYAGGSQAWQNIDLMMEVAAQAPIDAFYTIASHDHSFLERKALDHGIKQGMRFGVFQRVDLPAIYNASDFGFVLREDTAVNRVACPTKLTEYLEFGVVPIVKLVEIGDFAALGYEYVTVDEFAAGVIPGKDQRRRMVAQNQAVLRGLRRRFRGSARRLRHLVPKSRIPCGDLIGLPTFSLVSQMPWKREVYVFGDRNTYISQQFHRPYQEAVFDLPSGAEGRLVRLVPMVGDFIARLRHVVLTVDDLDTCVPDLVQSRGRPVHQGECFGADAPFVEIRLRSATTVRRVSVAMDFIDIGPGVWKTACAARRTAGDDTTLTIRVETADHIRSYDLPVCHV